MATGAEDLKQARERMVQVQLRGRDITDERVLEALSIRSSTIRHPNSA